MTVTGAVEVALDIGPMARARFQETLAQGRVPRRRRQRGTYKIITTAADGPSSGSHAEEELLARRRLGAVGRSVQPMVKRWFWAFRSQRAVR